MSSNNYVIKRVWQSLDVATSEKIVNFWLANGALPNREQAEQRVNQVAFVAFEGDEVVAVNTAYLQHNPSLDLHFYYLRAFVAEGARQGSLATQMMMKLQSTFESLHRDGLISPAVGLFLEVENIALQRARNFAIWPNTKFVYVGRNDNGAEQRVYYFDGVKIS